MKVLIGCFAFLVPLAGLGRAQGDNPSSREYEVKAAFLYNLVKFVEWPQKRMSDPNEPITIGILGKDPFGKAFDPIKDKPVEGRKIVVRRLRSFAEMKQGGEPKAAEKDVEKEVQAWRRCHVMFICASEQKYLKEILDRVKEHPVLTVGDTKGFLESGGIINFVIEQEKVRFEISTAAAKLAGLKIRSQLLRLAKRVVQPADAGGSEKKRD